jgi:general secretion pathway protein D
MIMIKKNTNHLFLLLILTALACVSPCKQVAAQAGLALPATSAITPEQPKRTLPLELQKKETRALPVNSPNPVSEIELDSKLSNDKDEKIEFNFEDADLQTLVKQVEEFFDIVFITDEMIQPLAQGGKAIKGNKITFKTNKLLSKQEAWDLFISFLSMAGFSVVPDADPKRFKIKTLEASKRSPIATFIGTDALSLPDNDEMVRYVYFIENSTLDTIKTIVDKLRSPVSDFIALTNHKGFILTDKAYNIKTLMQIVKELDKVSMPQSMSVLKLKRADARQVKDLYETLIKSESGGGNPQQFFQARKQPTSLYFPENTTIIAEPRTNALILLGTQDSIKKIEDFIIKNIDVDLDKPYSPLYVYPLKYADAATIADIMTQVTRFGQSTPAGKSGGVRGPDKYMQSISFIPEKETNRLIIKGHYEDYLAAKTVVDTLDQMQQQLAIEILILGISLNDQKQLGAQIRSKDPGANGLVGNNVKFQTSGLYQTAGIVENSTATKGVEKLLGDLVKLAQGAVAGNTIITLGSDAFGVSAILQAFESIANTRVISNPFVIATNKTPASISVGETRRVQTGTIVGTSEVATLGDEDANLTVTVTPQINSDGMIVLDLDVDIVDFVNLTNPNSATKTTRKIKTTTTVSDGEVLALGGLVRNTIRGQAKKTPILSQIPIIGYLFKNEAKQQTKDNLLILVSVRNTSKEKVEKFNKERLDDYHGTLAEMERTAENKDPLYKAFFAPKLGSTEQVMDNFLFDRANAGQPKQSKGLLAQRREKKMRKKNEELKFAKLEQQLSTAAAKAAAANQQATLAQNSLESYKDLLNTKVAMPTHSSETKNSVAQNAPANTTNLESKTQNTTINSSAKKRTNLALSNFFNGAPENPDHRIGGDNKAHA